MVCRSLLPAAAALPKRSLEDETGLLIPPDDPPALAQALTRLLNDAALRQRLGRAGRRWVERKMNWDRVGRQFMSIIDRAL